MKTRQLGSLALFLLALSPMLRAQKAKTKEAKITVETGKPSHSIFPLLFGEFFENINLSKHFSRTNKSFSKN